MDRTTIPLPNLIWLPQFYFGKKQVLMKRILHMEDLSLILTNFSLNILTPILPFVLLLSLSSNIGIQELEYLAETDYYFSSKGKKWYWVYFEKSKNVISSAHTAVSFGKMIIPSIIRLNLWTDI